MSKSPHAHGQTIHLTGAQVLRRYGRDNPVWLHRRQKDPDFPKALYIAGQRYWRLSELEAYEAAEARKVAPAIPPPPAPKRKRLAEHEAA